MTSMKTRLLRPTLQEAMVQMGKDYRWKEDLMSRVQAGVRARAAELTSQEAYSMVVQSELNKARSDLSSTVPAPELDQVTKMVQSTLDGIPFNIFAGTV